MNRRHFLTTTLAVAAGAASPLAGWSRPFLAGSQNQGRPVFLDCDTANEVDDLFAIVRALKVPGWDIKGLASTQWQHHLSSRETVRESQELNEQLLRLMGREDIPAPMGANMIMGYPWGGDGPRDSPAARLLIRVARQLPEGQRLTVIATGAGTNVASAIKLAPDIIPRVAVYQLGARYFSDGDYWSKDEFNVRRDLNAFNFLLDAEGLEYHVMPVTTLFDFKFKLSEVVERHTGKGPLWEMLATRWLSHSPDAEERIIWDLAMVQALMNPDWATEQKVKTPPENRPREIWVYTDIDEAAMIADWWSIVPG